MVSSVQCSTLNKCSNVPKQSIQRTNRCHHFAQCTLRAAGLSFKSLLIHKWDTNTGSYESTKLIDRKPFLKRLIILSHCLRKKNPEFSGSSILNVSTFWQLSLVSDILNTKQLIENPIMKIIVTCCARPYVKKNKVVPLCEKETTFSSNKLLPGMFPIKFRISIWTSTPHMSTQSLNNPLEREWIYFFGDIMAAKLTFHIEVPARYSSHFHLPKILLHAKLCAEKICKFNRRRTNIQFNLLRLHAKIIVSGF